VRCPIETQENLELLLDYGTARAGSGNAAFEQHLETCAACRDAVVGQQAVRSALDLWVTPEVSASFNHHLYERIEQEAGWRKRVGQWMARPLGALLSWRGIPIAAAACLMVTAGVLLEQSRTGLQPAQLAAPDPASIQVDKVKPEQVVNALDDLEMLGNFDSSVRAGGNSEL
jgi:hypothetical protein